MRDLQLIFSVIVVLHLHDLPMITSLSSSMDSTFLQIIHRKINDTNSLNSFYRRILQELRQHRIIDTVTSPINVSKIRSNDYDQEYLKNSVESSFLRSKKVTRIDLVLRNNLRSSSRTWL